MESPTSRCRKHAQNCRELAERATTDELRRLLSELADRWAALSALYESLYQIYRDQR